MAQATYPELLSQGLGSEPSPARPACKQVNELCSCLVLLPMGVAWPSHCCERRWSLTPPFHPCQLPGSLFLWPCPEGYPSPGVTRHRALRSADFPRFHQWQNRDRPTNLGTSIIPFSLVRVKIIKADVKPKLKCPLSPKLKCPLGKGQESGQTIHDERERNQTVRDHDPT